ncbi:MAG: hypothetical protein ACHQ50_09475 [Fimbriimonadales bacterium]
MLVQTFGSLVLITWVLKWGDLAYMLMTLVFAGAIKSVFLRLYIALFGRVEEVVPLSLGGYFLWRWEAFKETFPTFFGNHVLRMPKVR